MADYKVKSYSSYASSMSKPTSSGMSSKLDSKGYTPKSTSSSSVADKKGYTPTKSTSTASGKKYVSTYNDNYESPKTDKTKYSTTGLGAKQQPQQPQTSKQNTEDRFANAYVSAGGTDSLGVYKPQPMNLYEKPSMQVIQDYLTGTAIQDSLYEAQGLINQATTPQMKITTSPMTAEEIKKFVPVKELTEKGITVEQLSSMDAPTQKATLESLGITNAKFVSSAMENVYPMSLKEFDKITMDSVHYGNPSVRDPKQSMYNTIQQPTQQGLGYNQADITPAQPSAEQATILPNSQAMMAAPTLGEEPNLDTLSNQMLEKPVAAAPSAGLMSRNRYSLEGPESVRDFIDTKTAQLALAELGYDIGRGGKKNLKNLKIVNKAQTKPSEVRGADGVMGNSTKEAIKKFQEDNGLTVSGELDAATAAALENAPKPSFKYDAEYFDTDTQNKNMKAMYDAAVAEGIEGLELVALMSQAAHESDSFKTAKEYASGKAYEGRKDLGNTQAGDGKRYKGRGYLQITGRTNYKKIGNKLGLDLISNPEKLEDANLAAKASVEWWKENVQPIVADFSDVERVTKIVNGGFNGLEDRRKYYNDFLDR